MTNILDHTYALVKPQYDTLDCWVHSWPHVERVSDNAKLVAQKEGLDYILPVISAYCHDLGRIEEEVMKSRGDSNVPPHALLSIEPTAEVLRTIGLSGKDFGEVIEAVTVHSYRVYEGGNNVAKVLQDADKMNGFGPYGILGAFKYFGNKDLISPEDIVENRNNPAVLWDFCDKSLDEASPECLKGTLRGLGFVLEWYDMLHTDSAKRIITPEYYTTKDFRRKVGKKLLAIESK
ncbi:hypothetical protein HOD75_04330 [archaeon]|jgi:HD superfamily phosphodiesterase|nr:hypothetical protein [archaeon]MBT4242091.1 hypothetical protein [archaeon]MBT4417779.1 hypothetical protein [archaeon]